ncbi:anti-sigma factor domain-containing protein [Proteiniborus sp. MB09-C3]|uniref:anti-sigma factor domain-containing protein n=1 Tax=Proteiniborus sp. MB09-C3 TaxID=3050072 RepID=UPI002554D948|nr:anti-sigma factor domain-containing protein [Proteiniborus sp. MB09-C3]WIV11723.1 anti-sigma factor domain-containing protein [Proteiniborus sp. MB09-C3]
MRGIVMEKNKSGLIVMTDNGQFLEIKNHVKSVEIGQEIEVKNNPIHKSEIFRKVASIAAAIILFLSSGYGILGYHTVYGYVDVDINPNVELSYNRYKRVIGIKSLNKDGENILANVKDYKNQPIEVVVNKIIDSAIKENYIKNNEENTVLVTITGNKNEIDDKKILEEIDTHIKDSSVEAKVVVIKSDKKSYDDAKKNSLSPGKAKLIEKAAAANKDINPSEIKDKSINEIMSIIKENKKENKGIYKGMKNVEKWNKELDKNNKSIEKEDKKKEDKLNTNSKKYDEKDNKIYKWDNKINKKTNTGKSDSEKKDNKLINNSNIRNQNKNNKNSNYDNKNKEIQTNKSKKSNSNNSQKNRR